MKKFYLFTLLVFVSFCFCGYDPATFIQNGIGVRATSMGGAFVSILEDPSSVYYNPAGISSLEKTVFLFSSDLLAQSSYETIKDITPQYQNLCFVLPLKAFKILPFLENPTFGFGFINYFLENIPYTYIKYINEEDFYIVRDEIQLKNNAYLLNFSDKISIFPQENLYYGISLRLITQNFSKIEGGSSFGYDFVLGAIYSLPKEINIGVVVNRGIMLKWANGEDDTGPFSVSCGISKKFNIFKKFSILGSFDLTQKQKYPLFCNLGFEADFRINHILKNFYFRLGSENLVLENRHNYQSFLNKSLKLSMGVGTKFSISGFSFFFDYMLGLHNLGNRHKISIGVIFQ